MNNIKNACRILETYHDIMRFGLERAPRGQKCRDLMNGHVVLFCDESPCTSFEARNFNLEYAKAELRWYIDANPYASWIEKYATAWKKLRQPDGKFYSNYGQYLFNGERDDTQFEFVVNELKRDRDSRRATMVLLQPYHLFHDNIDVVCTYAMQFGIYGNTLEMTVLMRSNDAIWGFTNDVFCFWNIYQMVYALLKEHYPDLERGTYTHHAVSLHIYERHYEMVENILKDNLAGFTYVDVPFITAPEVRNLLDIEGVADDGPFTEWLKAKP